MNQDKLFCWRAHRRAWHRLVLSAFLAFPFACGDGSEDAIVPIRVEAPGVPVHLGPTPTPVIPSTLNPFGLNVHVAPFDVMQWERIAWFGAAWVRVDVPWWEVSRTPDGLDWNRTDGTLIGALDRDLQVLALLSGTPPWVLGFAEVGNWAAAQVPPSDQAWSEFVTAAVRRYRPGGVLAQRFGWPMDKGVRTWEIWNEPDLSAFWSGTAAQYRDRIWLPAVRAIRREDPQARIAFGGLCCFDPGGNDPWSQGGSTSEVLSTDESRAGLDIFSVHYYPRSVEQTALLDPYREMEGWLRGVQGFLDHTEGTQRTVPIWLTETGFQGTLFGDELTEDGVRRIVGRILLSPTNRLRAPERGFYLLEKMFVYDSHSKDYGLFDIDPYLRPKPVGAGYRDAIRQAANPLQPTPMPTP